MEETLPQLAPPSPVTNEPMREEDLNNEPSRKMEENPSIDQEDEDGEDNVQLMEVENETKNDDIETEHNDKEEEDDNKEEEIECETPPVEESESKQSNVEITPTLHSGNCIKVLWTVGRKSTAWFRANVLSVDPVDKSKVVIRYEKDDSVEFIKLDDKIWELELDEDGKVIMQKMEVPRRKTNEAYCVKDLVLACGDPETNLYSVAYIKKVNKKEEKYYVHWTHYKATNTRFDAWLPEENLLLVPPSWNIKLKDGELLTTENEEEGDDIEGEASGSKGKKRKSTSHDRNQKETKRQKVNEDEKQSTKPKKQSTGSNGKENRVMSYNTSSEELSVDNIAVGSKILIEKVSGESDTEKVSAIFLGFSDEDLAVLMYEADKSVDEFVDLKSLTWELDHSFVPDPSTVYHIPHPPSSLYRFNIGDEVLVKLVGSTLHPAKIIERQKADNGKVKYKAFIIGKVGKEALTDLLDVRKIRPALGTDVDHYLVNPPKKAKSVKKSAAETAAEAFGFKVDEPVEVYIEETHTWVEGTCVGFFGSDKIIIAPLTSEVDASYNRIVSLDQKDWVASVGTHIRSKEDVTI